LFERVEVVAVLGSVSLLLIVLELVRRKKLKEEYSLLWLLTCIALLILSFWRSLLEVLAQLVGIFYPPTALFVVGLGFVLLILLHFSTVISKLSTENKQLAQRLAILSWKLRNLESKTDSGLALEEQEDEGANEAAR